MWQLVFGRAWQRSFAPLFWLQFLGALNDNVFKNALVILITYRLSQSVEETGLWVSVAAGLFILPFVLFSPWAGRLADQYDKVRLIQKIKLAEIGIMAMGALALTSQSLELMLIALFLMGTQSAFFGPIKYAILPQLLPDAVLAQGNALFSGSTFIAILLGTLIGGVGILWASGEAIIAGVVVSLAFLGYLASLRLSVELEQAPSDDLSLWQSIQPYRAAIRAVMAISWFWFFGAVILSQIPTWVKYHLTADENVVVLLLSLFSIGIAFGSALVLQSQWLKSLRLHGLLLVMMALSLALCVWLSTQLEPAAFAHLYRLDELMQQPMAWALMLVFFLLSTLGGAYIVPLYTFVQTHTPQHCRSRMISFNNIVNALLMVVSALLLMIGFASGLGLLQQLVILSFLTLLYALLWQQFHPLKALI